MKVITRITKEMLQKEIENCPISVVELKPNDMREYMRRNDMWQYGYVGPKDYEFAGCYLEQVCGYKEGRQEGLIYINSRIVPLYKKMAILFHEMGHFICFKDKHKNCNVGNVISEKHAFMYELQQCLENGYLPALHYAVKCIWKSHLPIWTIKKHLTYHRASCMIVRSIVWRESIEFLTENGIINSQRDILKPHERMLKNTVTMFKRK